MSSVTVELFRETTLYQKLVTTGSGSQLNYGLSH